MDKLIFTHKNNRKYIFVDWDLSSICNYNCYYCGEEAHDGKFNFPKIEHVRNFIDKIQQIYSNKEFAIYNLLGGEPTLWKDLKNFTSYVKKVNDRNIVQLLTNGSRSLKWWKENALYMDRIIVSIHVANCKIEPLIEKLNNISNLLDIEVQVAIDLNIFDKCIDFYNYAYNNLTSSICLRPKPLKKNLSVSGMMDYTNHQIDIIKKLPQIEGKFKKKFSSSMILNDEDVDITSLITDKKNNFKDWACWIGIDTINVRRDGRVKIGSACNPDLILGNIKDCNFNIPMLPVKCRYNTCECWADLHTTKVKNYAGQTL